MWYYTRLYIDTTEEILQQYWLNAEQIENIKQATEPKKKIYFCSDFSECLLTFKEEFTKICSLIFPNMLVN